LREEDRGDATGNGRVWGILSSGGMTEAASPFQEVPASREVVQKVKAAGRIPTRLAMRPSEQPRRKKLKTLTTGKNRLCVFQVLLDF